MRALNFLCDCECFCTNDVPRPDRIPADTDDMVALLMCVSCTRGYHVMVPGEARRFYAPEEVDQRRLRLLVDAAVDGERPPGVLHRLWDWLVKP
jgi:hypothetical protein